MTGTEIGSALLQRYELLELKYQNEVKRFQHQVSPTHLSALLTVDTSLTMIFSSRSSVLRWQKVLRECIILKRRI